MKKAEKLIAHTDEYSVYDTYDDKKQKGHLISFEVDEEGKGEALFTIPEEWENKHQKLAELPRYFYLKEKESGVEFPRAYYVANPNKTEEENKKNSIRITALMLKVAKTLQLKDFMEANSAVILGSEPSFTKHTKSTEEGVCIAEARVKAFMRMLRVGEGTVGEQGYSIAFGGSKIKDLSTHPKKNYGGSTAAGAYQIMKYTYAWLGGSKLEWTGKYFKILEIYEKEHDYIKKYNIPDFQPESQDKLCLCLMHNKKGMIQSIIDNNIEEAIRKYGSSIWASLPYKEDNSRYKFKGKLQPAVPMRTCLKEYHEFLKEELNGQSDLHLKSGFLKEFGYNCCSEKKPQLTTNGVLDIMKSLADQHIPYAKQSGSKYRTGGSKDALQYMDCSEFICRYLHELGVMPQEKVIITNSMTTEAKFKKALGTNNIEFVSGSNLDTFIPQPGDIFVWSRSSNDGHTGLVYKYDKTKDTVWILEAITKASGESFSKANGGDNITNSTRTSVYKRNGGALSSHSGWIGYFRPINYTKKL